jgi:hypothetical protein
MGCLFEDYGDDMKTQEASPRTMMSTMALNTLPQHQTADSSPHLTPALPGRRLDTVAIAGLALVIALLCARLAFFSARNVWIDELGLYNPIYMYLHYGKMTYPIHHHFEEMVVHPPTHYVVIAWLMKLGLNLYYAEAVPPYVLTILILYLICRGGFPNAVKLGLLIGVFSAVSLIYCQMTNLFAQLRPDTTLTLALMAGLLALESGRLEAWNSKKLFLGSLLLTYASGLHYPAGLAFTGVGVYLIWACWTLGIAQARRRIVALVGGACLFGIPFLVLFVEPHWKGIWMMITSVQSGGGIQSALARHFAQYDWLSGLMSMTKMGQSLLMLPLEGPLSRHIPVIGLATVMLLLMPSTRGIALAGLPYPLVVLLYSQQKSTGYYIAELALYMSAVVALTLVVAEWIAQRVCLPIAKIAFIPTAAVALGVSYFGAHPVWPWRLAEHEMDVARAASRELVGPNAVVAGRLGTWYTSGAIHWFDPTPELLYAKDIHAVDLTSYFRPFDAVVEYAHMSDYTLNAQRATLSTWYVDGTLNLRGFYLLQDQPNFGAAGIGNLFLSVERIPQVSGYVMKNQQLFRFDEEAAGEFVAAALIGSLDKWNLADFPNLLFYDVIRMPKRDASDLQPAHFSYDRLKTGDEAIKRDTSDLQPALFIVIMPRKPYEARRAELAKAYGIRDEIIGQLQSVNPQELLAKSRRSEQPMRFYRTSREAVQRSQQ